MRRNTNGFTLTEMLIVVAVIGILAGLLFSAIDGAHKRARISTAKSLVNAIDTGMQAFKADFGHLPTLGPPQGSVTNDPTWIRRWLLGLDNSGQPDSVVRDYQYWNGPYVEVRIEKHLGADYNFVDSWENPIYFETDPNTVVFNVDRWDVWSLGPDGEGTTDMGTISGSSYKAKRDNYNNYTLGSDKVNRDNVGNW